MRSFPLVALLLVCRPVAAQPAEWTGPTLVADLNSVDIGSHPADLMAAGDQVFFSANVPGVGGGVWVTDGTAGGVKQITDLPPLQGGGYPLSSAGERVLITDRHEKILVGATGVPGESEVLFESEHRLSVYGNLGDLAIIGEYLDGTSRLWATDGTLAGTARVTPDSFDGVVNLGVELNGSFYFFSGREEHWELWVTDGLEFGASYLRSFPGIHGGLYALGETLIIGRYDGDHALYGYQPSSGQAQHLISEVSHDAATVGEFVITTARGDNSQLIRTDGSVEGTTVFASLPPGGYLGWLGETEGVLFFGYNHPGIGRQVWRIDGTAAGTFPIDVPWERNIDVLLTHQGKLYFYGFSQEVGWELWMTDGTVGGTVALDIAPGPTSSWACWAAPLPNGLAVSATLPQFGQELLLVDPSAGTATLLADLAKGETLDSKAGIFTPIGHELAFVAADGQAYVAWRTDGSTAGTVAYSGLPTGYEIDRTSLYRGPGGTLYAFAKDRLQESNTLWRLDSNPVPVIARPGRTPIVITLGGRLLVAFRGELYSGSGDPGSMTLLHRTETGWENQRLLAGDGLAFFQADRSGEWYVTDGTPENTWALPGPAAKSVGAVTVGNVLYSIDERGGQPALWRTNVSDGSAPELVWGFTRALRDDWRHMKRFGDRFLFYSDDRGNGFEPWISDGTTEGTRPLFQEDPSGDRDLHDPFHVMGTQAFFVDREWNLWVISQSDTQPRLLAEGSGSPTRPLSVVNGELIFAFDDGVHGNELWATDGQSTRLFIDLNQGTASSYPKEVARVGDRLFVSATVPPFGHELWVLHYHYEPPERLDELLPTPLWVSQPFPNPTASTLSVLLNGHVGEVETSVVDALGREVGRGRHEVVDGPMEIPIDTRHLPSGIYFLRIKAGAGVETRTIVVSR